MGFFDKLKNGLNKTKTSFDEKMNNIFIKHPPSIGFSGQYIIFDCLSDEFIDNNLRLSYN